MSADEMSALFMGVFWIVFIITWLITMAMVFVSMLLMCKVYSKMGLPWWSALVPYYNTYVLFDKLGINIVFFILLFVPGANIVGFVYLYIAMYRVIVSMDYGIGMFILYLFIPPLAFAILGFGSHTYRPLYEKTGY